MIILLNGVPNSGKSTVSKELMKIVPRLVHLEIDKLTEMVPWMPLSELIGLAMENAGTLLPNFVRRDLNVVIDYPLDLFWHRYLVEAAERCGATHHTFTLKPSLATVSQCRGARSISEGLSQRIQELYNSDMNDPSIGVFIDNTDQSPEETARVIWGYAKQGAALS